MTKEMKEKIKYLNKGESTYCCKGQVLVHVWRCKKDVKLITALHRAKTVEIEKRNEKGKTTKKLEIIQDYNKFTVGVDEAEQILHYCPCCRITMKWTKKSVFFMLHLSALKSFIFKKVHHKQKSKCQRLGFQGK